ncbi:unnamed protein product [Urochloa decumbens]|uniref:Uncharacterized protein n=1 Tax=Urochloa decumbens TaxID=240449 RepID=A0ABC8ZW05_9POAL
MEYLTPSPREEGIGVQSSPIDSRALAQLHRSNMMQWVNLYESCEDDMVRVPPVSIIMYRDLLQRAWGWERLLPKVRGSVDWDEYKRYLEEYWQFNAAKAVDGKDALDAAANKCIEAENNLIRSCVRHLTLEALSLGSQIKNRARGLIQSDGEYPAAAVALLCITNEAELMYELLSSGFDIAETLEFSTKVRQCASNLMLYKGPDSANAAAGAMMGVATKARMILDSIHQESPSGGIDYFGCQRMRTAIGVSLTKLEKELNAGTLTDRTEKSKDEKDGEKGWRRRMPQMM